MNGLERVVTISNNPFVNADEDQFDPIVVPLVQGFHEVHQHRAVLPATCSARNLVASREEFVVHNCPMHLRLKKMKKASLA